jgi:hypothetical protein
MSRAPNDSESPLRAFRVLQHVLRMLQSNTATKVHSITTETAHVGTTQLTVSDQDKSAISTVQYPAAQQHVEHRCSIRHNMSPPNCLTLSLPNKATPECSTHKAAEDSLASNAYYCLGCPILFQLDNIDSCDIDGVGNDITSLVSATLLLNLAVVCHQYAMTQSEVSHTTSLLRHASKVNHLLHKLLLGMIATWVTSPSNVMKNQTPETYNVSNIVLLMTIMYNNLGCLYFELDMVTAGRECMAKLADFSLQYDDYYRVFQSGCFEPIIEQVKLNIIFCKFYVPSRIATAA